jgi:hypothetical protein
MTSPFARIWLKAPRCIAAFCVLAVLGFSGGAFASSQPKWRELTPVRQAALAPLATQWDKLEDQRKEKWLVIADKYAKMKPEQQHLMQTRMADWVKLTPEQRRQARISYQNSRTVAAEKKKAEWEEYQHLPEADKKRLAAAAEAKKPVKEKAARRQMAIRGVPTSAPGTKPPVKAPSNVATPPVAANPPAPAAAAPGQPAGHPAVLISNSAAPLAPSKAP